MATETRDTVRAVSKLRHWKQQWNPNARFIFRKAINWAKPLRKGQSTPDFVHFPAGAIVEDWVREAMGGAKLRRWWESGMIELLDFGHQNVLTGVVDLANPFGLIDADGKKTKAKGKAKTKRKRRAKFEPLPEHSSIILAMLAEGATNKVIASTIGASVSTLKRYFSDELLGLDPNAADPVEPISDDGSEEMK